MKCKVLLLTIFYFTHFTTAFAHGVGGGTYNSHASKKHTTTTSPVKTMKLITERMMFTLETKENIAKLWINNSLNQPMDTSLTSATVLVSDDSQTTLFKMMPTEQGHIMGAIPVNVSSNTKFDVILRIQGERPINISFIPGQSSQPTNVSQKESR